MSEAVKDSDLPPPWISDADLIRMIERLTRRPASLADAKAWRRAIDYERTRRSRWRVSLPLARMAPDTESAHGLIMDLLLSPEGQAMIGVLLTTMTLAAEALDADAHRLYCRMLAQRNIARDLRSVNDGLVRYAAEKLAPGGRYPARGPDPAHALPGTALVFLNSCTPQALAEWHARLVAARRAPSMRQRFISGLCALGTEIAAAYPELDIARPEPGPPRGIWPRPLPDCPPTLEGEPQANLPRWRRRMQATRVEQQRSAPLVRGP